MRISIKFIPHSEQRYETVGDWQWVDDDLYIVVSQMGDWRKEVAVAIHELVEVMLCKEHNVKQQDVDIFDREFENNRPEGNTDEPGDDPAAPYKNEHFIATTIERIFTQAIGLDWNDHEEAINNL